MLRKNIHMYKQMHNFSEFCLEFSIIVIGLIIFKKIIKNPIIKTINNFTLEGLDSSLAMNSKTWSRSASWIYKSYFELYSFSAADACEILDLY